VKVDQEETFHLRHGEMWMKRLSAAGGEAKEKVQRAVDWMFPMAVEWFGLPDDMKRHSGQLEYRLKGMTNDELRQTWMKSTVPLCESIGIEVPAHWDEEQQRVRARLPFPCEYDETRSAGSSTRARSRGSRSSSAGRGAARRTRTSSRRSRKAAPSGACWRRRDGGGRAGAGLRRPPRGEARDGRRSGARACPS
jgi:hypothetical protein